MKDPWGRLSRLVERERRRRELTRSALAGMVGLDPATLQRVLDAESVRVSTVRVLTSGLGLDWGEVVATMAAKTSDIPAVDN